MSTSSRSSSPALFFSDDNHSDEDDPMVDEGEEEGEGAGLQPVAALRFSAQNAAACVCVIVHVH